VYTLYIGNKNYSSWSLRGWLAMMLSRAPFTEVMVSLSTEGTLNPANRAFSPTTRVPCLHDDATVVWDSLAIAEYLAERHPECGRWIRSPAPGRVRSARRCTRDFRRCAAR
jgi:glutathione S-transferase